MYKSIMNKIRNYFDDKIDGFVVEDTDDINQDTFTIRFEAYESFTLYIHYNAGNYSCYFMIGGVKFHFKGVQEYFETEDYETLFSEIKQELELRLPDKFLEARGWL